MLNNQCKNNLDKPNLNQSFQEILSESRFSYMPQNYSKAVEKAQQSICTFAIITNKDFTCATRNE